MQSVFSIILAISALLALFVPAAYGLESTTYGRRLQGLQGSTRSLNFLESNTGGYGGERRRRLRSINAEDAMKRNARLFN